MSHLLFFLSLLTHPRVGVEVEMNETEKNLDVAPKCFEEAFPFKREYWGCTGFVTSASSRGGWICVNYSKEDAEAYAVAQDGTRWKWDRNPASPISLSFAMAQARQMGTMGVRVSSYVDGKWKTVNEFPANVPLPLELRD